MSAMDRLNKFVDLMGQHNALFLGNIPASALDDEQDALIENPNPIALCCNCRFWRDNERPAPNAETGECRRYPPIINGDYPNQMGDYPNTLGIAWCGEWQAK